MTENQQAANFGSTCTTVVKSSSRLTPETTDEVRHIVLHIDEPSFRYLEGQCIGVLVPGPHEFGNEYHHRHYSIANSRASGDSEGVDIDILVRRCFYIDEFSGEEYRGIASNYLCDAKPGDRISITGPYRSPFKMPGDETSNLLMIGTGTGIAPFRAFMQHIYDQLGGWKGQVRLFYGARNGMDLLYMNDENRDLSHYYDEQTFKAFKAVGGGYFGTPTDGLENALANNVQEALDLIRKDNTYVYLAGQEKVAEALNKVMSEAVGSEKVWQDLKQGMIKDGRWTELLYH
ncbi:MAG: oxidoreductase [Gammaproteobacteria bacterium]|nr:oxidoreductase [Gammaproteobacteria bacterium]MBU1654776.1 oxidoreductase [Gammaproteobacteria bacterium]MBU1962649.1 oxidoreductase [Gammaproteobacteria bacterium]